MNYLVWFIILIFFAIIEAFSYQLISIWFAVGALAALFCSFITDNLVIQIATFTIVSLISLIAFYPIKKKLLAKKITATNADRLIGTRAIALADFDPISLEGRVKVKELDWLAIGEEAYKKDDIVIIDALEGAKVYVRKEGQEN